MMAILLVLCAITVCVHGYPMLGAILLIMAALQ